MAEAYAVLMQGATITLGIALFVCLFRAVRGPSVADRIVAINMTGTVTDMLRADRYTFDAGADDYASRFYITYRVTDVEEHNEGDGTFAWFDGSEWIVEGQGVLDVVDVMGRTVYSERLVNERNRVGLNGVAKGVYLLRVSDGTNTMVQKIVVR